MLASSGRKRRELELQLLESLQDDDDAVEELMMLWLCERDAAATRRLQDMEQTCSNGLVEEETYLRSLIQEYGFEWVEPSSRLACLLFYKGRTEESMNMCQEVLKHKPWHFEALHLHLLNAILLDNQQSEIWDAARKTLPPLNERANHRRRRAWVKRAVTQARESFQKAEQELQDAHIQQKLFCRHAQENVWQ